MLPENVVFVLNKLHENGYQGYAVGGCVRDTLLNKVPDDWDITTNALPDAICRIFNEFHLNLKGLKHGTVGVIIHGQMLEVTTYRIDGAYSDLRRPENVTFSHELTEDLSRRDFTVNAMAMDINGNITDVFNGRADLSSRTIKAVGDPIKRFSEDALRIMRGLRFASAEGFKLEENTLTAANALAGNLKHIAYERIYTELKKMLALPNAGQVMEATLPVFKAIFPTLNTELWPQTVAKVKSLAGDMPLSLAAILLTCDTALELDRLKAETKLKKQILALKQLLNIHLENDRMFLQKLMCVHGKESVTFLCRYIGNEQLIINCNAAASGITSTDQLAIDGTMLKEAGYKSYKIKQAKQQLLTAVIEGKCLNNKESLMEYLRKNQ